MIYRISKKFAGDKSLGKETYKEFNDTYVPDIIRVTAIEDSEIVLVDAA